MQLEASLLFHRSSEGSEFLTILILVRLAMGQMSQPPGSYLMSVSQELGFHKDCVHFFPTSHAHADLRGMCGKGEE